MKLSINLNEELVTKAKELTGIKTKKAIVNRALQVMVDLYSDSRKEMLNLSEADIQAGSLVKQDEVDKIDKEWLNNFNK